MGRAEIHPPINLRTLQIQFLSKFSLKTVWRIHKIISHLRPNIIHVHGTKAGWLGRLAAFLNRRGKLVWTSHLLPEEFFSALPFFQKNLFPWLHYFLNLTTDRFIALSNYQAQSMVKKPFFSKKKIKIIPNGVSPHQFPLDGKESFKKFKRKNGIKNGEIIIGTAVRLSPQKSVDTLIKAFFELKKRAERPTPKLLIIGDGEQRQALEILVQELNLNSSVIFTGFLPDASAMIKIFDLFILPSKFEGMPLSILEAFAAEVPVIASKVSGIPELITEGETGWLVKPESPQKLLEKMDMVLSDLNKAKQVASNAKKKWLTHFTTEVMISRYREFYNAII